MKRLTLIRSTLATCSALLIIIAPVSAAAAKPTSGGSKSTTSTTGNDVSWPQCGSALPIGQLFGVVGVNDGLANTTNPCFSTELSWAESSIGGTGQPIAALYVNTANPGNTVADWPTSGTSAKYGTCTGGDDLACAYIYGQTMATNDAQLRIGTQNPASFKWWLDIETGNSWETNTANNTADLEGMVDYFQSLGAPVGIYSTSYQLGQIVGTISSGSSLYGLNSWLPGARRLSEAQSNCSLAGLAGGQTVLTQYTSHNLDYDYSCI